MALVLSSCFLPQPKTAPTFSVAPTTINAYSGQPFNLSVTGQGGGGISQIVATFQGSTVIKNSNPATFTFVAPTVIAQTKYNLGVTVYGKNGLSSSATEAVNVIPYTSVGSITYAVRLNNPYPYVYTYPAQSNNQSVIFTVNVGNGAGMVGGVSVYVDGTAIPASPTTLSSVLKATVAGTSFIVQKSFVALYSISLNHVGPHTYWINFYGTNGSLLGSSAPGYFYITYPGAQKVTLSAATPLYNAKYINGVSGNVSFTAQATDYTSQYEGFLINGTPFKTYLNIATAVSVLGKSYSISVPASVLTSAGSTTFTFKDVSIDGNAVSASRQYVVVKSAPVLKVTYKGAAPVNNVLYVGINPSYFNVYASDPYWMTSGATLSSSFGKTPYNLNKNANTSIDVSFLNNSATATFTAYVENYANVVSSTSLKVYRISVGPVIKSANVYGLRTVNGTPYTTSGTITIAASVIMAFPNLGNVTWELSGVGTPSKFALTRSSTGLWVGSVNTANLLPGTYNSSLIAEDVAQNSATALTTPATVNVYRAVQNVFTTSLTTTPPVPINGFVKSATLTANINHTWVYAIREVSLYREVPNGTTYVSSGTQTGNAGSTYAFTINASGTYKIVTVDNANQRATQVENPYTVKIDNSTPLLKFSLSDATPSTSTVITVKATDLNSGISTLLLEYQTLGSTGANNGTTWVPIYATSTNNATYVKFTYTWTNLPPMDGQYHITLVGTSGVGIGRSTSTTFVSNKFTLASTNVSFIFPPLWTNSTSTVVKIGATVNKESDVTIFATSGNASLINFGTPTYTSNSYNVIPFTHTWSATFTGKNATSVAKVTVKDLAGNTVSATKLIGFDNLAPTATQISAPATVAGNGATFTVTLKATDNLSAVKSVTVGGIAAAVSGAPTNNEFGVLSGTYVATLTVNQTTSGATTYKVVVVDNAGNTTKKTFSVYVDANAPTITVGLVNKHGPQPISNGASEVNYTSTPASFTWHITTKSGTAAIVKGAINDSVTPYRTITTDSGTVTVKTTSSQYVITIVATNPINGLSSTFLATKTVVIDNTSPTVKLSLPATLNLANYSTAVATYTATDTNFKAATLTINGVSVSVSKASSGTVLLSQFNLNGLKGRTLTATLTAIDKALNTNSTSTIFYVDTVSPHILMTGTIYKSGPNYDVDVNFGDIMKPTTLATTDLQFYQGSTLWYNIAAATGVSYDPSTGFLHIYNLVTPAGSIVSVSALANHQFTVKVSTAFESLGGNPLSPSSTLVTFSIPYGAPKPVNP
ncbi:MAG: hypothetical protein M1542_01950 [Thermotogae bacterium]|nr:hypothetical protein [Thermotogota bacterium]MCL5031998.1 hypothetical protein [Thermotogota bacterium]